MRTLQAEFEMFWPSRTAFLACAVIVLSNTLELLPLRRQ